MKKVVTLCAIYNHPRILLGMKKRGFGVGRWNGFGGKLQGDESIEEAALRELKEEASIDALDLNKVGIMDFEFENGTDALEVHIFKVGEFIGEPVESEEMRPEWFHVDEIPFNEMWTSDTLWLPLLLADKKFKGKFFLDKPSNVEHASEILKYELFEVDEL